MSGSIPVAALLAAVLTLAGCGGTPEAVQYPPGQRPCSEAQQALYGVTLMQLRYGSGPNDPDGLVRKALKEAKTPLSYRAGESTYYSAAVYNGLADRVLATVDPLVDAYDREDPNTPYEDAPDWWQKYNAYQDAHMALTRECGP